MKVASKSVEPVNFELLEALIFNPFRCAKKGRELGITIFSEILGSIMINNEVFIKVIAQKGFKTTSGDPCSSISCLFHALDTSREVRRKGENKKRGQALRDLPPFNLKPIL